MKPEYAIYAFLAVWFAYLLWSSRKTTSKFNSPEYERRRRIGELIESNRQRDRQPWRARRHAPGACGPAESRGLRGSNEVGPMKYDVYAGESAIPQFHDFDCDVDAEHVIEVTTTALEQMEPEEITHVIVKSHEESQ